MSEDPFTRDSVTQAFHKVPWLRVFVEGAVIVGSILLAFGIDAWWEERQERKEERVALEALRQEFVNNIEVLRDTQRIHVDLAETADRLNELLLNAALGETIQVADSLLYVLIVYRTPDVAMGTLNTLLASGRIGIIHDRVIQQALAGWPAVVQEAVEEENLIRDYIVEELIPGLAGHADLTGVMAARTTFGLISGNAFDLTGERYAVQVDAESRTLVGQRAFLGRLVISASHARLSEAGRILTLIESGLIQ